MRLKVEIIIVAILLGLLITAGQMYRMERTERIRTEGNQTALLTGQQRYKTKDSLNVLKVQELNLTNKEFKTHEKGLLKTIDGLEIKVKRMQSISSTATETKIEFQTVLKDSLIYLPGKDSIIEMKCLEYKNAYVDFSGCIIEDIFDARILIFDTLIHVAHRVPKNIWFIKYGTKSIDLEVLSKNPYTEISYSKNIRFTKN